MNIFNRYFWQETSLSVLMIMLGLLAMFSFFDLIQELDSLGKGSYGIYSMLQYVLLSVPGHIYEVAPVAVLIGMMYSLGALAKNSELVVMRASGLSLTQIGISLIKVGLMFTLITFLVGELIAPVSEKMAQRARIKATNTVIAQDFKSGLWIKDGKSFVNVQTVLPDATLLQMRIYEFDDKFRLRSISNAKQGVYLEDKWGLSDVTQTQFTYKDSVQKNTVRTTFFKKANWVSQVKPELLNVLLVQPEKMSAWNLYSFIQHLARNNQRTIRYEMALWSKLVYPLACIAMVILALPFGFINQRSGGTSTKLFIGIALGIVYQILNRVSVHLGVLNDWSPLMSATMPTLLFLVTALVMIYWIERR